MDNIEQRKKIANILKRARNTAKLVSEIGTTPIGIDIGARIQITAVIIAVITIS